MEYRNPSTRNRVRLNDLDKHTEKPHLRGGYLVFFLVLGIAITADVLDVFNALLNLVATGLLATVVGSPIGAALGLFSTVLNSFWGILTDFTIMMYFSYIGGKLGLRFAIMSIGAILDIVPGLNILPMTTIMFVIAFLVGRIAEKIVSAVTKRTPLGAMYNLGKKVFS